MSPTITQASLILILPLIGFVIQILTSKRWPRQGDWIPTTAIAMSCLLAWNIFTSEVITKPGGIDLREVTVHVKKDGHSTRRRGRIVKSGPEGISFQSGGHTETIAAADLDPDKPPFYTFRKVFDFVSIISPDENRANTGDEWLELGPAPYQPAPGKANIGPKSSLTFHFSLMVDNLTAIMLVVVTTVSFLVHLYSTGYMVHHGHKAPRYNRFFAFLGLFSFSMLGLVLTDSLFFLFVFWELVGLCSYFLIGFEFERQAACRASIKAFITTKIGDTGFFIALMIIGAKVGHFGFGEIFESVRIGAWEPWLLSLTAIMLFIGPIGKSAQFPLHVWLPDAMEGPTPVSALIHAATMVVAGVYLVARMLPFFAGPAFFVDGDLSWITSSTPLMVVAFVGGFTSLYAATIALVQTDMKKVLAYSTVSQLGYMVLAMGVGSISAGTFHLWTHAFFKACLFLGAGSVIHAVETGDMRLMGNLRRKMPITFYTFLISTMAIAGVPLMTGFYSKEAVLTQAFMYGDVLGGVYWLPFVFGMITAVLTPFYMFRIICLAFMGRERDRARFEHAHESPWNITVPLIVLATLAVCAGGMIWTFSHEAGELTFNSMSFLLVVPIVVSAVFMRPFGKPLLAILGIYGVLAVAPPFLAQAKYKLEHGAAKKEAHKSGEQHMTEADHGKGHGDGHDDHASHADEGTFQWFNNRVGNRLFLDIHAVATRPDMVQPEFDPGVVHETHGNLLPPKVSDDHDKQHHFEHNAHISVMMMSLIAASLGIGFAWLLFLGPLRNETIAPKGSILAWYRTVLENLYYMDHLYWWVFVEGTLYIRQGFAWFDRTVIDGIVNWFASAVLDIRGTAAEVDQRALGLGTGASIMVGVLAITGLGNIMAVTGYEAGAVGHFGLGGEFGSLSYDPNVVSATITCLVLSIVGGVLLWLSGVRKGAAALTSALFALSGFIGARLGHKISGWAHIGPDAVSDMLAPFAMHPVAGNIFAVLLVTFVIGVWAGIGIDGTVRFIGEKLTLGLGGRVRKIQTGRLQDYLLATVLLAIAVIVITTLL